MSRKSQLIAEYKHLLKHVRTGKRSTRESQLAKIRVIINDLYVLPQLSAQLRALTQADIRVLVAHWQERGFSQSTMINKMSSLRFLEKHLGFAEPVPTNRELGLKKETIYCPISEINGVLNGYLAMENTLAKTIFGMVLHFGMTFSEIVHCVPLHHFEEAYVNITRDIAFNSKERQIPIVTDSQRQLIAKMTQLLKPDTSLCQRFAYKTLRAIYHAELTLQKLPRVQHRHYYAWIRYQQLRQVHKKKVSLSTLRQEMGFETRTPLWHYLRPHVNMDAVQYEQDETEASDLFD